MYMRTAFILFALIISSYNLVAQVYGRGLNLSEQSNDRTIVSAKLMRGDFEELPPRYSLKKYCPTPGNQGIYATCAGWASAYSGRTILNAIKNNYINPLIDQNTFSPSYIYNQIRKDSTCNNGVDLVEALEIMKDQGVLLLDDFGYECERNIQSHDKYRAIQNRILEYKEIFNRFSNNKVITTKKSISEFRPVVIAIDVPRSFEYSKDVWIPEKEEYKNGRNGHALVVVSYDDTLYGGAFEIINSWGTDWGNQGFTWIKYTDFEYFTYNGFELIDDIKDETSEYDFSGSISFVLEDQTPIQLERSDNIFCTVNSLSSGTKFNIRLSNDQPAFVYAFGSDLKRKNIILFPPKENISPLLSYKKNNLSLPDERSNLMLDKNVGKTYLCFIYANKSIDIKTAMKKIEKGSGDFVKRVFKYFKNDFVTDYTPTIKDQSKIIFKAKSDNKSMIIIILEIKHV